MPSLSVDVSVKSTSRSLKEVVNDAVGGELRQGSRCSRSIVEQRKMDWSRMTSIVFAIASGSFEFEYHGVAGIPAGPFNGLLDQRVSPVCRILPPLQATEFQSILSLLKLRLVRL